MVIGKVEFRWIGWNVKRKKQHYILNFFAHVLYDYPRITYIVNRMIDRKYDIQIIVVQTRNVRQYR